MIHFPMKTQYHPTGERPTAHPPEGIQTQPRLNPDPPQQEDAATPHLSAPLFQRFSERPLLSLSQYHSEDIQSIRDGHSKENGWIQEDNIDIRSASSTIYQKMIEKLANF